MLRSFTDRVLGGVCGGIARTLRLNVWLLRALFVIAGVVSAGAFAALYLLLWWMMPQESLVSRNRGGFPLPLFLLLVVAAGLASYGFYQGWFVSPGGASLYVPFLLVVVSAGFFLRQVVA